MIYDHSLRGRKEAMLASRGMMPLTPFIVDETEIRPISVTISPLL